MAHANPPLDRASNHGVLESIPRLALRSKRHIERGPCEGDSLTSGFGILSALGHYRHTELGKQWLRDQGTGTFPRQWCGFPSGNVGEQGWAEDGRDEHLQFRDIARPIPAANPKERSIRERLYIRRIALEVTICDLQFGKSSTARRVRA